LPTPVGAINSVCFPDAIGGHAADCAGVGSAIGLLQAAPRIDVSTTRVMMLDENAGPAIAKVYAELEARAHKDIAQFDNAAPPQWSRHGYMRYAGQGFEVQVPLPGGAIAGDFSARAVAAFNEAYLQKHKFLDPDARIEAVDWTLVATLPSGQEGAVIGQARAPDTPRRSGSRLAWFPEAGGYVETQIIDRQALANGATITGPAIIEDPDSTTVLLPGDLARLSGPKHLIINIAREGTT